MRPLVAVPAQRPLFTPRLIFHEPLSGSLLAAALCVLDLCLLAGAVHLPTLFHPGLLSVRRCSELQPSLRAILSVPILGIVPSASPFSLWSTMRVVPVLHHSTASVASPWKSQFWCWWMSQGPGFKSVRKEPPWKYPFFYFEICAVYSEEPLWLRRKYRQETRSWWSLMQLWSVREGAEELSGSKRHKKNAGNPSASFQQAWRLAGQLCVGPQVGRGRKSQRCVYAAVFV